jgi:hypothetical protein
MLGRASILRSRRDASKAGEIKESPVALRQSTIDHEEGSSMRSHRSMLSATALTLTTALAFDFPAIAADLPQSGNFKLHSGWKGVGEVVQVGDNHVFGIGNFLGRDLQRCR